MGFLTPYLSAHPAQTYCNPDSKLSLTRDGCRALQAVSLLSCCHVTSSWELKAAEPGSPPDVPEVGQLPGAGGTAAAVPSPGVPVLLSLALVWPGWRDRTEPWAAEGCRPPSFRFPPAPGTIGTGCAWRSAFRV